MAETTRFKSFLSYSHKDARHARWLHRRLESYRLPRRLIGTEGERGPVPARISPIFRDREELPAAGDLSEKVRGALAASEALVILCSPHSARSPWVAKEIATFRSLHPDRPILAAIVKGEPAQCFPSGLADGDAEPLAADLRPEGDGRRLGVLKLVAGLAGIGLDALVQRDAQRRLRRVTAVTLGALAGMVAMTVLAIFAFTARAEAERQRAEAEGLVEFMLTDLRDRLKGVGRIDVLTAANARALAYYQGQDLKGLPADSLGRRARILHAMGEDDLTRKNVPRALAQFQEAARTTTTLLESHPADPDRIFAHAQSAFWVGRVHVEQDNSAAAKRAFQRYKALADQLVAVRPGDPVSHKEAGFADGNLCTLALQPPQDPAAALSFCSSALDHMRAAAARSAGNGMRADLANRHAWLADAYRARGDWAAALRERREQERLLRRMLAEDPRNAAIKQKWVLFEIAMADFYAREPHDPNGLRRLTDALGMLDGMIARDPENASLAARRRQILQKIESLGPARGE